MCAPPVLVRDVQHVIHLGHVFEGQRAVDQALVLAIASVYDPIEKV
jgi:hypothetical protein